MEGKLKLKSFKDIKYEYLDFEVNKWYAKHPTIRIKSINIENKGDYFYYFITYYDEDEDNNIRQICVSDQ